MNILINGNYKKIGRHFIHLIMIGGHFHMINQAVMEHFIKLINKKLK
jgi:hypothetical protein